MGLQRTTTWTLPNFFQGSKTLCNTHTHTLPRLFIFILSCSAIFGKFKRPTKTPSNTSKTIDIDLSEKGKVHMRGIIWNSDRASMNILRCPGTSSKARDKPLGVRYLRWIVLRHKIIFPLAVIFASPWGDLAKFMGQNRHFSQMWGGFLVMCAARGKTWQNKVLWPT